MTQAFKQVPYSEPSFEMIRALGYAYVDKTAFIQTLETCGTRFPFIVRPRRFGKSLFADMLMAYYDKAAKEDFSKHFSGTWIGAHPTPLANTYLVLKFDFSGIDRGEDLVQNFTRNVMDGLSDFMLRYFPQNTDMRALLKRPHASPAGLLSDFLRLVREETRDKVYLIIDEYDQFAQEVLSTDPVQFRAMTGSEGFLKTFYSNIKRQVQLKVIERTFITGVTSISLDSMTSGFNIATNISNDASFAGILGFTDEELRELLPQVVDVKRYPRSLDEIFLRMKTLYDGYRFCPKSDVTVFNASMCLYYLRAIAQEHSEPRNLLDPAFSVDLTKIEGILSLGDRAFVDEIVNNVLVDKPIPFGTLSEALNLNARAKLSNDDVLTALVFMGFLTFSGESPDRLICPNAAVKEVFFKYWFRWIGQLDGLSFPSTDLQSALERLEAGDIEPFLTFVSERMTQCAGTHAHIHMNEAVIQFAVSMAVNVAWHYKATAEEEALGAGFTDLILRPTQKHPKAAGWLIEFKYLKKSEATPDAIAAKLAEAEAQLKRYALAENIATIPNLHRAAVVFSGTTLKGLKISQG